MRNKKSKNIEKAMILILMIITIAFPSFSQNNRPVSGTVSDENGEALIGVSVQIKGTGIGVATDINGQFNLNVANSDILVVSMIGFVSQEIPVNNKQRIDVTLLESTTELQDIVVIGYGTVAKKDITGAISVVKGEEINKMSISSVSNVLQGKTTGVTVSQSSGTPGAPAVVRIRGIGSIHGSNTPLYIVDGLPQNDIDYLNPNDIESIAIHKDASVAAIYGSRASNGIIIITTKTGSVNETATVQYDNYLGFQSPWKRPYMLNAREFIEYKNRAADAVNAPRLLEFSTDENIAAVMNFVEKNSGPNGTDWWNEITNNQAFIQNHNLSFSAGTKNLGIHSSLAYLDQDGIIKGSEYERLSWRNNLNVKLGSRVSLKTNIGVIYEKKRVIDENNPYTGTIFSAMTADPITPVYRSNLVEVPSFLNHIYNGYEPNNLYSLYSGILYSNKRNPVAQIERMRQSKYETYGVKGGADLDIKIFDFLKFNSRIGVDVVRSTTDGFQPKYVLNSFDYSSTNTVINSLHSSNYFINENILSYEQTFNKIKLSALAGYSFEVTKVSSFSASVQGIINNDPEMRILNNGTLNPTVSGYPYSNALNSYFGRIGFDYDSKYIISANLRRDGSSKFAKQYRWGTFPSISGAWRFSAEEFLTQASSWLSDGKLRISYGHIGNQNISGGSYMATYGSTIYDRYMFGDENTALIAAGRQFTGNPLLQWETSKQFDVGVDLILFDGKIEFIGDYFNKTLDNMLMIVQLPTTLGYPNFPYVNVGSMVNYGWEFGLTYRKNQGDFKYDLIANISTYKNRVISLGSGDAVYGSAYLDNVLTKTEVGMPVGYFYGYVTNGIFQNEQEVENGPQRDDSTPGDVRYKDLNKDDFINSDDRTFIGSPWPDFVYGITANMYYRNFDLSIFLQGSQGNEVMNIMLYDTESGNGYLNAAKGFLERAWDGEGSTDRYHKISQVQGLNNSVSDYFVEDGSYLRIKNIQLGYNFSPALTKLVKINHLRLYVSAQNLFTFTNYSGLDPEIGSTDAKLAGIDQGFYPQARVLTVGLNIKF